MDIGVTVGGWVFEGSRVRLCVSVSFVGTCVIECGSSNECCFMQAQKPLSTQTLSSFPLLAADPASGQEQQHWAGRQGVCIPNHIPACP